MCTTTSSHNALLYYVKNKIIKNYNKNGRLFLSIYTYTVYTVYCVYCIDRRNNLPFLCSRLFLEYCYYLKNIILIPAFGFL